MLLHHNRRFLDPLLYSVFYQRFSWWYYRQIANIRRTDSQNLTVSLLHLQLSSDQSIETRCQIENEDVVGAAPSGDAPTTSEWSAILLPTQVRLILEVRR